MADQKAPWPFVKRLHESGLYESLGLVQMGRYSDQAKSFFEKWLASQKSRADAGLAFVCIELISMNSPEVVSWLLNQLTWKLEVYINDPGTGGGEGEGGAIVACGGRPSLEPVDMRFAFAFGDSGRILYQKPMRIGIVQGRSAQDHSVIPAKLIRCHLIDFARKAEVEDEYYSIRTCKENDDQNTSKLWPTEWVSVDSFKNDDVLSSQIVKIQKNQQNQWNVLLKSLAAQNLIPEKFHGVPLKVEIEVHDIRKERTTHRKFEPYLLRSDL
jgi:hypothetical protein